LVLGLLALAMVCCAVASRRGGPAERVPSASVPGAGSGETGLPVPSRAPQLEDPLCLEGCPEPAMNASRKHKNQIVRRNIYVISNNPETKFADWAAYRFSRDTIGKSKRTRWKADPEIPPEATLEPEDYRGAHRVLGTDRGHVVPLATLSASPDAAALNYLSNCTPQKSALNQQAWNRLESAARRLARSEGVQSVYGMTGPLYERAMPLLPWADEAHQVPSGYFKILALTQEGKVEVAAFVLDQETAGGDSFCDHQITVSEIESRTGLDFFVGLPDLQEAALEGRIGELARRLGCQ